MDQRTDNTMAKRKWTKEQTMMYKALHRKLKQSEPTVPVSLVASVMLLLLQIKLYLRH
jgi:hypothetical protein